MSKKETVILFLCAHLIVAGGCAGGLGRPFTGLIVQDQGTEITKTPYETTPPTIIKEERATQPYDVKEELLPERWEIVSDIPATSADKHLKLGTNPVSPVNENTVAKLQKELAKMGIKGGIYINKEPLLLETQSRSGQWFRGWIGPGYIFLTEEIPTLAEHGKPHTKEFRLIRIAYCWNPMRGVTVRMTPAALRVTERYRDTVTVATTERYRDINTKIDYTPAIWAFALGAAVGWFVHPAAGSAAHLVRKCLPGQPAPR